MDFCDRYNNIITKYEKYRNKTLWNYGTAGFRGNADTLKELFFKVGIFTSLRSISLQSDVGLMITASHNPPQDNGIKIVDSDGGMMAQEAEEFCNDFVNCSDEQLLSFCTNILQNSKDKIKPHIIIGYDSRGSSPELLACLMDGITLCLNKVVPVNIGLTTTPCLHFSVLCNNYENWKSENSKKFYIDRLIGGYQKATALVNKEILQTPIHIDCANGVASVVLDDSFLKSSIFDYELHNADINTHNLLNVNCGADYIKTNKCRPVGFEGFKSQKCLSFDGDADRIVYFSPSTENGDVLLDGDRILCIFVKYFKQLIKLCDLKDVSIGAIQTAYANGASSQYIREVLNVDIFFVPTGVKHLVKKAKELDLGVYFEANGHGSVYFSDNLCQALEKIEKSASSNKEQVWAAKLLLASIEIMNPTIGDAISAMLLVEIILQYFQWTLDDWALQYLEFPSKLIKVQVVDRLAFQTCDAERRLVSHCDLQEMIDKTVEDIEGGRCFVRPSGTEDVVRIYAEAKTEQNAQLLAFNVAYFINNKI